MRGPEANGHPRNGRCLSAEQFAVRFQASYRVLWTIAAGVLGDPSQAEDVLQESAVIALGKLDRFDPETSFTAWMGRVVQNVALNLARKARRRASASLDPERLRELSEGAEAASSGADRPSAVPGPGLPIGGRGELLPDRGHFDDRVLAALHRLEPSARASLLLRTLLALEYREIAAALGIPEGTAMSHVHRSRARLRRILGGEPERRLEHDRLEHEREA